MKKSDGKRKRGKHTERKRVGGGMLPMLAELSLVHFCACMSEYIVNNILRGSPSAERCQPMNVIIVNIKLRKETEETNKCRLILLSEQRAATF